MASDRTTIQQPDVEGIRAAAQWLLGAVGAVAVLVMAGFQIGEVWKLALSPDWRLWGTVAGVVLLLIGTWNLITAAVWVLVPDRNNITDLLTRLAGKELTSRNIETVVETPSGGLKSPPEPTGDQKVLLDHVNAEISRARGWLLPAECDSLDTLYSQYKSATSKSDRDALRANLAEVVSFAHTETALWRFRILVKRLLGWAGGLSLAGLILLVICAHPAPDDAPSSGSPTVTAPVKVDVYFRSDDTLLKEHGIDVRCASSAQPGFIIGGTLAEPLVLIAGSATCPQQRVLLTSQLGNAMPQ